MNQGKVVSRGVAQHGRNILEGQSITSGLVALFVRSKNGLVETDDSKSSLLR